jgi:hypothetical protein
MEPRRYEYPSCKSHSPLAGWSEIDSELCAGIAPKPTVSTHAFNRAVDSTLNRCLLISNQRGGEYQDTWSEANLRTAFLDATLRGISEQQGHHGTDVELIALTPAEKRLLIVAAMVDVKLSRMIGPWKDDTVLDAINYLAAYAAWMGEYLGEEA